MDTGSFLLSFTPRKSIIIHIQFFSKVLDVTEMDPKHELHSEGKKKVNRQNET